MSRKSLETFEFTFADHGTYRLDDLLANAKWRPAKMPGDSIRHLQNAGVETADPLQGDNQRAYLPYEKRDFIYRTRISTKSNFYYTLVCHGLDTFCDVYLDGKLIHRNESSFIRFQLDLTGFCSSLERELVFVFLSPTEHAAKLHPDFDASKYSVVFDEPLRVLVRKPQFHYGWDNAPHLAGVGFIGIPYLCETQRPLEIRDVNLDYSYDWKVKHASFTIRLSGNARAQTKVRPTLFWGENPVWEGSYFELSAGSSDALEIARGELANVQEWQVRGYGQPNLYKLTLESDTGETIWERTVGFRHIELSTRITERRTVNFRIGPIDDVIVSMDGSATDGNVRQASDLVVDNMPAGPCSKLKTEPYETEVHEFRIIINGTPIFLRGFNWQPLEQSLANISDERWSKTLALYKHSGANILRIWGGGYIEDERLYDFCDKAGIFVWQDFQFACALYPDADPEFRKLLEKEVRDIYLRLHLSPSIGLFCGSNEIDMMLYDRGLDILTGNTIGYNVIPETLKSLGSTIPYHPSSPSGNDYPRSPFSGDTRNWTAREYVVDDYPLLRQDPAVMNSEGGFPSFPSRSVLTHFLPEGEPSEEAVLVENSTYQLHAGSTLRWDRGKGFFAGMYRNTRDCFSDWRSLDGLIYLTQLSQADALARYVEIFRYKEDHCGGCAIWKFSDLWPCVELSVVDYDLRPKQAYYTVARALADTVVCPFFQDDHFTFSISSSVPLGEASLQVEYLRMDGSAFFVEEMKLDVRPGINHCDIRISRSKLRETHGIGNGVFRARLLVGGKSVSERIFFPEVLRRINFQKFAAVDYAWSEDGVKNGLYRYKLGLRAPHTLIGVNIRLLDETQPSPIFSDNAFHLIQGEHRDITVESPTKITKGNLEIQTLNSISLSEAALEPAFQAN